MKRILTTLTITVLLTSLLFGQVDKDYAVKLKKMFEVSGGEETYKSAIKQMLSLYKQQHAELGNEFWQEIEKELLKTSIGDLTEMLVPVYVKYFSIEDIDNIIKFYETPIGKKFAKNQPFIVQESMQVGQQWGQKLGQVIINKIREKK